MPSPSAPETPVNAWSAAVKLLTQWLEAHDRVDTLLEQLPRTIAGVERARCQSLFYGAVRHYSRIDGHLKGLVNRAPRPRLQAILLVAGFEILEGGDEHHLARVVHHAVEQAKTLASPPEAKLVNAVVRKLGAALAQETEPPKLATAEALAAYFSHPDWLVRRWLAQFGATSTRALLEWNQRPAVIYARWRLNDREPNEQELVCLAPTSWKNYYEIKPGHWPRVAQLIESSAIYLQDPSTRMAIQLLNPQPGESILDACAAPGGKSLAIADMMLAKRIGQAEGSAGRVVSLDLPSPRIDRLKENLSRVRGVDVALVQGDVTKGPSLFKLHELPQQFTGVLVDVPCSNTGVMRHRVDVKWRLQENDFPKHARQQLALLGAASRMVGPGGRVVYSTCSLDAEENERVVQAFVERAKGRYELVRSEISRPWESGHDGAAAFLLERKG
jgi:16S rRNA (cytosine967-C5)-methyltransferase